jgi:hypothetical protein
VVSKLDMEEGESPFRIAGEPRKELPPPPRVVSADLVRVLRYGRATAQVGWAIATVGAIVLLFVLGFVELDPPRYDKLATGALGEVDCTNRPDGTQCEAAYGFYDHDGNPRMAMTSVDLPASRGDRVLVEYDARDSQQSRIAGTGHDQAGWTVIFAPIGLIAIGLVLVIWTRRAAAEDVRLLRFGLPTTGTRVPTRKGRIMVDRHHYVFTFEYVVNGRTHRVEITPYSPEPLADDAAEPMVYDPADPDNATALDDLPGRPRIRDDGTLAADVGFIYHLLVLPAGACFLIVAAVAVLVLRVAG